MLGISLLSAGVGACSFNAASLWTKWVTNRQNISYWDNREQIANEKEHPIENPHPYAEETRFLLNNEMVTGHPEEWSFVAIEIGNARFCPKLCSPTLFGMQPLDNCSTMLTSYDVYNEYVGDFIDCLYSDSRECKVEYSKLVPNGIYITYDYGYNATWSEDVFYGEGGGITSSGSQLFVQETIAQDFVAPLELFYDADGNLQTSYTEPLVYKLEM